MIKLPFVDRVKFMVERQFVKGAGFQLLVVAGVIALISVIGGVAIWVTGAEGHLLEWIWWAFLRLTDPGYLGDDEGAWRRFVSTALTVSGYVVFLGALVAIMTQWLIARMREFERGLTPVALKNHVVIIGWTNRTIPLLRELVGTERSERRFLAAFGTRRVMPVVLSEEVSAIHSQELRADPIIGRSAGRIILRYGSPLEEEAIHRAACLNAAAVIMPSDFGTGTELISADVETIRALLSMDARAEQFGQKPPLVIAEIQDVRRMDMVRRAYRGPLEIVPSDDTVSRLLAQNVLHPGLSAFFRETLTAREGNEFYLRQAGPLVGASLRELASRCPKALVLGLLRPDRDRLVPMLNAASSEVIRAGDLLVFLAAAFADTDPGAARTGHLPPVERGGDTPVPRASGRPRHRLLMLGWSHRVPNLIMELASYTRIQFEIDLLSTVDSATREREIAAYSEDCARVAVRHVESDFLLSGELEKLDLDQYTAIYLLTSDRLASIEEADARSIVGHRIIEGLLHGRTKRPQILLELADAANEGLIRTPGAETLVSPLIVAHVLAQVALRREMRVIFDELFTVGGAEIVFRSAGEYRIRKPRAFIELEQAVGARGDTLLGVQINPPDQPPSLSINPPRDTVFDLADTDRLCVLTTIQ